jgi:hypothetical protein
MVLLAIGPTPNPTPTPRRAVLTERLDRTAERPACAGGRAAPLATPAAD